MGERTLTLRMRSPVSIRCLSVAITGNPAPTVACNKEDMVRASKSLGGGIVGAQALADDLRGLSTVYSSCGSETVKSVVIIMGRYGLPDVSNSTLSLYATYSGRISSRTSSDSVV